MEWNEMKNERTSNNNNNKKRLQRKRQSYDNQNLFFLPSYSFPSHDKFTELRKRRIEGNGDVTNAKTKTFSDLEWNLEKRLGKRTRKKRFCKYWRRRGRGRKRR